MTSTGEQPAVGPVEAAVAPAALGLRAQLVRFVLIGGFAACVDLGLYQLLLVLGVWAPLAKGVSFILGTTTAYLLNRRFTFASSSGGGAKFVGFLVLYGSTFAVNVGVASLVLHLMDAPTVGTPFLPAFVSWFVAQACATTINFIVMRTLIFKD
ncbi:GtrA family protein [Actinomycetospora sp. OC33-EN08]|uniref:GtrA family protein n=1 Tax=Actinomycetospora aurantiaca TaxID=3129233 RepID=A0ABU8MQU4_9PSEU